MSDELVEPTPVPVAFATGVGPMHVRGGIAYMTLTVEQCALSEEGMERIVVARIAMPVGALRHCMGEVAALLSAN